MRLIIGLGNPGKQYEHTRHNVGYMVIDTLQKNVLPKDVIVKNTGVFMNNSGQKVKELINYYKVNLDDLYIIHDDLDIELGEYKIQKSTGPKDHKGILSIEEALGTKDFWRVRVGVDNRDPDNRIDGETYVLQDFSKTELKTLDEVIKKVINAFL